jgi:hypothetical protein
MGYVTNLAVVRIKNFEHSHFLTKTLYGARLILSGPNNDALILPDPLIRNIILAAFSPANQGW